MSPIILDYISKHLSLQYVTQLNSEFWAPVCKNDDVMANVYIQMRSLKSVVEHHYRFWCSIIYKTNIKGIKILFVGVSRSLIKPSDR